jgi:hypothetical protein
VLKVDKTRVEWSEAVMKKRNQLYSEIMKVEDAGLRSDLEHSYYKLMSFINDDVTEFAWEVRQNS